MEEVFWGPGEGLLIPGPDEKAVLIKVTGEATHEAYSLMEVLAARDTPWTVAHTHDFEEALYVLDGEMTVRVGENTRRAAAGSYVLIPRGTEHAFVNAGESTMRYLVLCSPPGLERTWLERAPGRSGIDPALLAELKRQHGL